MGYSHAQVKRTKDYDWRLYLTRKKAKKGQRSRKGAVPPCLSVSVAP